MMCVCVCVCVCELDRTQTDIIDLDFRIKQFIRKITEWKSEACVQMKIRKWVGWLVGWLPSQPEPYLLKQKKKKRQKD